MIKFSYPLLIFIDTLQFLYLHIYIVLTPLPYSWLKLNEVFKYFNFTFLPKLYTYDTTTTSHVQPYNLFETDSTLLGNLQPFVFIVAIYCGVYLIVWLLTLKKINRIEKFREKVKMIYRARFRYSILFEAFYLTLFYTLFFAFYQFKGYNN